MEQTTTRQRPGAAPELFTYYPDDMVRTHRTRLRSAAGVALLLTFLYDPGNRVLARETNAADLNASLPAGLAALDAGDAFTWDALSRPRTIDHRTGPDAVDLAARVAYSSYDLAGRPAEERLGLWPAAERLHRTFDTFGNTTSLTLPSGGDLTPTLASRTATFDTLDRLTAVDAGAALGAGYTWQGTAKPAGISPHGANALSASLGYGAPGGRLGAVSFTSSSGPLGGFTVGWQPTTGLKTTRDASGAGSPASLVTALDWQWSHDAAARLTQARTGVASARTRDEWTFSFGSADELRLIHSDRQGPASFTAGPEGRPVSRQDANGSEAFVYGDEGRRIEDARAAYTYDWRGRLVRADIKTPPEGSDEPSAGHRIAYTYDALGRLLTRTHWSEIPEGGSDEQREFIDKQQLLWDGDTLLAVTGLNFHDEVIWRQHLVPGPSGLDDAPQILVETGINATPRQRTFDLVRDELGSVIAVIEEPEAPEATLPLLARVFYSVTGEAHLEAGPEPMWIEFAPAIDEVGAQTQAEPVEGERVGGALEARTTMALDAPTWAEGVRFETWDDQAQQWVTAPPSEYAIGVDQAHAEALRIMRLEGWQAGGRYRITLLPSLADAFARPIQLPTAEAHGIQVVLDVPADGVTPPVYARDFPLEYDSVASASNTLCERQSPATCEPRFPAGMTHLWQGAWTDPVTGLGYHRERWYDARNASWLSEDPLGDVDSPSLYAYVGWRPHIATDPTGESGYLESPWDVASLAVGTASLCYNAQQGNVGGFALDLFGVAVDAAAVMLPVPGGAGMAIKAARAGSALNKARRVVEAGQVANQVINVAQAGLGAQEAFSSGHYGWGALNLAMGGLGIRQLDANPWKIRSDLSSVNMGPGGFKISYEPIPAEHHWRYDRYLQDPATGDLGPTSWWAKAQQAWVNARGGNRFERQVREALGLPAGRGSKPFEIDGYVPDLPVGGRFGVTEVKDWLELVATPQTRAFYRHARRTGQAFNLIVSPRTSSISEPLLRMVRRTGGRVQQFDSLARAFSDLDIGIAGRWVR